MNKRGLAASLVLLLSILACNLPARTTPTPVVTETSTLPAVPSDTPIPTLTLTPTDTPPPTFTPTPTIPIAWPSDKGVNCRFGPSTNWVTVGALLVGQTATIQGKNGDATWWYVVTPGDPNRPCWVAGSVTLTAGNLANVPVVSPPFASVTDVSVKVDPKEINLPGCLGPVQPVTIKGSITVNGPTKVEWHFETEQSSSFSSHTIEFEGADTKTVEDSFNPSPLAGSFWVKLVITKPENKVAEIKYKINCP